MLSNIQSSILKQCSEEVKVATRFIITTVPKQHLTQLCKNYIILQHITTVVLLLDFLILSFISKNSYMFFIWTSHFIWISGFNKY